MKVLIVCSGTRNKLSPFIKEQINALRNDGIELFLFQIKSNGVLGYIYSLKLLKKQIKNFKPDLIHAHYGLSGLMANFQRKIPVVTTYHGSDINNKIILFLSKVCIKLSKYNIFVSNKLKDISKTKNNFDVIPCAVDLKNFTCIEQSNARERLKFNKADKLILFAGAFDNKVKNPGLAQNAVKLIRDAKLIELKNYTREEVNLLMNAVDVALMTSYAEGSPQFIKEAMACNIPIVATDVGDIKWVFGNTHGCYITSFDSKECAAKIKLALEFRMNYCHTNGKKRIIELGLDSETTSQRIIKVYNKVVNKNKCHVWNLWKN